MHSWAVTLQSSCKTAGSALFIWNVFLDVEQTESGLQHHQMSSTVYSEPGTRRPLINSHWLLLFLHFMQELNMESCFSKLLVYKDMETLWGLIADYCVRQVIFHLQVLSQLLKNLCIWLVAKYSFHYRSSAHKLSYSKPLWEQNQPNQLSHICIFFLY